MKRLILVVVVAALVLGACDEIPAGEIEDLIQQAEDVSEEMVDALEEFNEDQADIDKARDRPEYVKPPQVSLVENNVMFDGVEFAPHSVVVSEGMVHERDHYPASNMLILLAITPSKQGKIR